MSQKAFLRAGYTATSLLMSYLGTDIESEYNTESERLGLSVAVKILDKDAYAKVYVPQEMRNFANKIYSRLGIRYDISFDSKTDETTEGMRSL